MIEAILLSVAIGWVVNVIILPTGEVLILNWWDDLWAPDPYERYKK